MHEKERKARSLSLLCFRLVVVFGSLLSQQTFCFRLCQNLLIQSCFVGRLGRSNTLVVCKVFVVCTKDEVEPSERGGVVLKTEENLFMQGNGIV